MNEERGSQEQFLNALKQVEKATSRQFKLEEMLEKLSKDIQKLGFDFCNISLISQEQKTIESVPGTGIATQWSNLAKLFELFARHIECVALNACYSEIQAKAIAKHIPYVIGMNKTIGDKAAIKFATGFYCALGAGESFEFAYKLGCNVIQLEGIPEYLTPVLLKK
jgi:hypothetical protein